jgi:hypothetical protein
MKSSFQSLIHFLPFLLNHLRLPSTELDNNSLKWTLLQLKSLNCWQLLAWNFPLYSLGVEPTENTVIYCAALSSAYVQYIPLLRMLNPAEMCLPSDGSMLHNILLGQLRLIHVVKKFRFSMNARNVPTTACNWSALRQFTPAYVSTKYFPILITSASHFIFAYFVCGMVSA